MGTNPYRESRVLRVALDEFLEKAAELERARNTLYSEEADANGNLVDEAVMTIYDAVPSLRTAVDAFEWAIDDIEEDDEALRKERPSESTRSR